MHVASQPTLDRPGRETLLDRARPETPAGAAQEKRLRIANRKNALQPESIRARLLPEIPRPCSVARKRRRSAGESPASDASPASVLSVATSRRYALRVCAGLVPR